ncbi:enoyl-CoA hydratase/isomerase family protein [Dactylosporangium sp. CA-092794]|uniref:enoyl-CoA hydratase/isomerase family protein n=1 Tax=Dactylosporangium sp. CA-092794 TaxID=3239929 RepID=UPI003D8FB30A
MTTLQVHRDGAIACLTVDRPRQANAIDNATLEQLVAAYEKFDADREVSLVVLRGAGKGFSSGHDLGSGGDILASLASGDVISDWHRLDAANRLLLRLWDGSLPILAAVHGFCLGAAVELVMMCDFAIAAEDARFAQPALRGTGGAPTELIHPFVMGLRRAKQYLWLSQELSGREAADWGLVNLAVPADQLDDTVAAWAGRIAAMPNDNIRLMRRAMHRLVDANGFRQALSAGVEIDAIAHASGKTREWLAKIDAVGLKQAVAERDLPFANGVAPK